MQIVKHSFHPYRSNINILPQGDAFFISDPVMVYGIQENLGIRTSFKGAISYAVGIDYFTSKNELTFETEHYIMFLLQFY